MFRTSSDKLASTVVRAASLATIGWIGYTLYCKYCPTESAEIQQIKKYYKDYYDAIDISKEVLEQLSWFQNNTIATSESNVRLASSNTPLHIEIKRALARWNCLKLLQDGSTSAYQAFVAKQPEAEKLNCSSFKRLSNFIKMQSSIVQEGIKASCFIAMSDKAKSLAKQADASFSADSEKFVTDTITQCPQIYPTYRTLSAEAKKLLPYVFLKDTHGRHMLYTEGGNNMFAVLKEKISNNNLTQEQYAVWLGRWIVNIAGFRGHENPHGSIYLTEKTAQAVLTLSDELSKLQSDSGYDVLTGYLQKRAQQLGIESLYLAHLGASMRLYTPKEGRELQDWFNSLSKTTQAQHEQSYKKMCTTLKTTPTYEVAVMDNLRALGCDISETLNIYSVISATAAHAYDEAIQQNKIDENTPLCFRDIAFKNNLQPIIDSYRATGSIPTMIIDRQGNVEKEKREFHPSNNFCKL